MMKATELRIGNFVRINKRIVKVESLDSSGINIEACGGYYPGDCSIEHDAYFEKWNSSIKQVTPITITEEWLLKFGFENSDFRNSFWSQKDLLKCFELKSFFVSYREKYEWQYFYPASDDFYSTYPVQLKYVHQLQNLYFALTGEELKLS